MSPRRRIRERFWCASLRGITALIVAGTGALAQDKPTVETIEANALRARREIQSAELILRVDSFQKTQLLEAHQRARQHLWLDRPRLRVDEEIEPSESGGKKIRGMTIVQCRGCYSDDTVFEYRERTGSTPGSGEAFLRDVNYEVRQPDGSVMLLRQPPTPWLFGFVPADYVGTPADTALDSYVGRSDRSNVLVDAADLDGRRCWRITYETKNGDFDAQVSIHVAPDEGWSIARISEAFEAKGVKHARMVNCQNANVDGTSLWFPTEMIFERREGDALVSRETVGIDVLAVNSARIAEAFALSAIPILKEGTLVRRQAMRPDPEFPRRGAVWTGGKLVSDEGALREVGRSRAPTRSPVRIAKPATPERDEPPSVPRPEGLSWVIVVNAAVFVVVAAFVVFRWRRRSG